jgi:PAS domain S-box-containing protein
MVKERREKELPKGKPRGRGKQSSSTRSQRNITRSPAHIPSIQPVDWEERYHALFDRSLQYVIISDFEGNILDANEMVLKLLGYSKKDIPHLKIASLLSEEQLPKASAALQELKDTGMTKQVNEWKLRRKDGSFVDMLLSGALIYHEGKPAAILGIGIDITKRKQVEGALRQSEEKYRTLAEQSLMGIIVIQDFRIIFANTAFVEISGYSIDELLSLPPEKVQAMIYPEDRALVWGRLRDRLAGKAVPPHYGYRGIRKDGTVRWLEIHANRIEYGGKPAIQAAYIDITDQKQAEESLRLSEQNFRDSIEKSPLGIRIVTEDGKTLYANKALLDICGYGSLEELKAVPRNQLYTPESYAEHRERVNRKKRGEYVTSNYEISIVRKDGQVRRLSVSRGEVLWDGAKQSQVVYQDITERKRAEEALQESEERYKALFDRSLDCVFVHDFEGNFLDANEVALKLLGYERKDIPHLNFASLLSQDQLPKALATLQEFKDTGVQKQTNEFRVRCKDGSFVDMEVIAAVIYHEGKPYAIQGVGRDITRRKRIEEALRQSEERYRAILERMEDSYFEVDLAGNLTFVNSAVCRHLGYSMKELIGMNYRGFTDKDYIEFVFRIFNGVYRTAMPNRGFPWKIIRKDGSPGFIDASVTLLRNDEDEVIGFSGVGRDITERKKMDDQLILTDRLASIGQLAAGIAHELNNPLTSVIGFSDLLLERDLSADVKEDLETVNQEARRAINIIKGLLAFAREQRVEKSLVDINNIFRGVLQLRSYEQRVSNIEVDARLASALPPIMGNGAQLQQVFINIIINAEQAMLEAHGRGKLTIVTEQVGDIVRASFTDDGPGISPDNMKKLFLPFFTTREVGKGTGLGLSICHGIVTEHDGKIYAESELGKGATFVVELPIST